MSLKSRIEKLEDMSSKGENGLPWLIVYSDDDEIPAGMKGYSPEVDPDLWDEDYPGENDEK
jgi:hypothetical protein